MPDFFKSQIRKAMANEVLQVALDGNADRRIRVRIEAMASLEDLPAMRRRAHAVRAEVITNLDHYLEQFTTQAQANGMIIHRAADGAAANQIVLDIARQNGVRLIAKSKTMVSEEIGFNHFMEAAGLQVVETDLGEYIIQLRGEHPSHIITPAVHLRRQECGQTFHEKLGIPLTDDVPTMTAAARRALREVFLTADMGLSGANFGVAETGGLCLVTNEGNGRMVTTLPPVHVALVGMERLVPTLDDLALLLALLARSATGQKMSVYTSLIHGPRRPGEVDGPRQRHVILLDNGRSAIQHSPMREALYCIRCGACLNACPVFRELGGHAYVSVKGECSTYPGPIGSVLAPALFGPEFGNLARASSLCGACKEACPVDIDLPRLLLRVRAGLADSVQAAPSREAAKSAAVQSAAPMPPPRPCLAPWYLKGGLAFFTAIAASPRLFHLAQRAAGFFGRIAAPASPWLRLPAFTGWGYSKDFPRPAVRPFREIWKDRDQGNGYPGVQAPGHPGASAHGHPGSTAAMPPTSPATLPLISTSLADRFEYELAALGGTFTHCPENELGARLLAFLKERGIHALLSWEAGHLPSGLLEELRQAGIDLCHTPDASLKAGLTGALAAVAETGTLVLPGAAGKPLAASLLPEIHLVVLREQDIAQSLPEVIGHREIRAAAAVALISGPSRTADIEMTLTIGVHGPGEVRVYCI